MIDLPTEQEKQQCVSNLLESLRSYHMEIIEETTGKTELKPVICAVCDSIAKCPNWASWVNIPDEFMALCKNSKLHKDRLSTIYNTNIIEDYTAPHAALQDFILSPRSIVDDDNILVCTECLTELRKKGQSFYKKPPIQAIANGFLVGDAPEVITDLSEVELALISKVKIHCHIWIYFAGCHKQIKGWHTFYKNRPTENAASLRTLNQIGVKGHILVVLCGPFTSTQKAITMKATQVRPDKVIAALEWLAENNIYYNKDDIPDKDAFPKVEIIEENW